MKMRDMEQVQRGKKISEPDTEWDLWTVFCAWAGRVFVVLLIVGVLILALTGVLGTLANQIQNQLFNTSQQHTGAVAQKFSDDCLQLAQVGDPVSRKAIENDIYQVASTVNLNEVHMPDTTRQCVNHAIQDVVSNK